MKIISFAWTTPALLARVKTVTRRDWKLEYAMRFRAKDVVLAYDKQPRFGGKKVGVIELTEDVYLENTKDAPESDYVAEGFEFLQRHNIKVDRLTPRALWKAWKIYPRELWVVRFTIIEILS